MWRNPGSANNQAFLRAINADDKYTIKREEVRIQTAQAATSNEPPVKTGTTPRPGIVSPLSALHR
jgi:hypothetical protein